MAGLLESRRSFAIPRRDRRPGLVRSPSNEGAGDAGCALHPRSRVQNCANKRTRAYRFSGNTPASPTQWLYGLWRDLLGDEFLFVTVAAGLRLKRSGWIDFRHRQLDTRNGCRNHTLLPYATTRLRQLAPPGKAPFVCAPAVRSRENPPCAHLARRRCRVHHISTHVRDDGQRPSCRVRRAEL